MRNSSLHSDLWDETIGLRLGIDNTTHWSSWFTLINKALKKQTQIKTFMVNHKQTFENIKLIVDDWDLLYKIHAFFQPFAGLTLCRQNAISSISQILRAMDALLKHFKQKKKFTLKQKLKIKNGYTQSK